MALAPALSAQSFQAADVGSFSIMVNGERVGREQFSIRHRPGADGRAAELRAESTVGITRSAFRLEIDSAGAPLRYAVEIHTGTQMLMRLGGQRQRGRFTTLSRGARGESAREYLLESGVHVLEDTAIHQYAVLLEACRGQSQGLPITLPVFAPLESRHGTVRVTLEATDEFITIAGTRRAALRWALVPSTGDRRLLWTDGEGRLLRLSIPNRGFEAIREELPR